MADFKSIKKGDKVVLRMFTGAIVEAKTVEMADAKKIGFTNKKGIKMVFSKETGKQVSPEPKSEKFTNYITEYDEQEVAEALMKKSGNKKEASKPTKVTKETKAEKPAKNEPKKKASKKKAEPVEEATETSDDDFEEVE